MTERGLPIVDGPVACPFVAFDDNRDERATGPDHRHRCYAETPPAPRAFAHQEAYCLSSAFPVCPTFQDWARREAARARTEAPARDRPAHRSTSRQPEPVPIPGESDDAGYAAYAPSDGLDEADEAIYEDPRPHRNPQEGWASPPPWMRRPNAEGRAPGFDEPLDDDDDVGGDAAGAQGGLAGSVADRLASSTGGAPRREPPTGPERGRPGRGGAGPGPGSGPEEHPAWKVGDRWDDEPVPVAEIEEREPAPRPAAGARRPEPEPASAPPLPPHRERERVQAAAPAWERPARLEAYPTLRSRRLSVIALPSILVAFIAILLAALVLFLLPGFLGIGSTSPGSSPARSVAASLAPVGSIAPTAVSAPTQQVYTVQAGDTMSKIANKFHIPLQTLIDANKTAIPNPNQLQIGQQVIIPSSTPNSLPGASPAASP
jgi:LysM repeat protein